MANWTDSVKIRKLFKALQNKSDTSEGKKFYEENIPYYIDIHSDEIYADPIPSTPPASSTSVVKCWTDTADGRLVLTKDNSVPDNKAWVVLNTWQSGWSSGSGDVSQIMKNFISPKYGKDYVVRVYHGSGAQISELDNVSWIFNYKAGVLTFEQDPGDDGSTPSNSIQIEVYQYVGTFGGSGGGSGNGERNEKEIYQVNHGLSVNDVIYINPSTQLYEKAIADSSDNAEVIGIVSEVIDSDNFKFVSEGYLVTSGLPGSAGDVLYLSDTTAGTLVTSPPSAPSVNKPVGVRTNDGILIYTLRGLITSGGSGINSAESIRRQITQTNHNLNVNDLVYLDTSTHLYTKALADNEDHSEVAGIVCSVEDSDNFTLLLEGYYETTGIIGNIGEVLYLSDTTPGGMTTIPPSSPSVNKPVGIRTNDGMIFYTLRGFIVNSSGGSSGSGEYVAKSISQASHGFSIGQWLYQKSDGTYDLADSTSDTTADVVGVVSNVIDSDNFDLLISGYFTNSSLPGNPGDALFLSDTSGVCSDSPPSDPSYVTKPLGIRTSDGMIVNIMRGSVGAGSGIDNISKEINQSSHGFSEGDVVHIIDNSGSPLYAKAVNTDLPVGIVTQVIDSDNFVLGIHGYFEISTLPSTSPGTRLYVGTNPGELTTNSSLSPSTPVGIVEDATHIYINIQREIYKEESKLVVYSPSHSFVIGDPVYPSGSGYAKAESDIEDSINSVVGIVSNVPDSDHFEITTSGFMSWSSAPGSVGDRLYIDQNGSLTNDLSSMTGLRKVVAVRVDGGIVVAIKHREHESFDEYTLDIDIDGNSSYGGRFVVRTGRDVSAWESFYVRGDNGKIFSRDRNTGIERPVYPPFRFFIKVSNPQNGDTPYLSDVLSYMNGSTSFERKGIVFLSEGFHNRVSGSYSNIDFLEIRGSGGKNTVIGSSANDYYAMDISDVDHVVLRDLSFVGQGSTNSAIRISNANSVYIENITDPPDWVDPTYANYTLYNMFEFNHVNFVFINGVRHIGLESGSDKQWYSSLVKADYVSDLIIKNVYFRNPWDDSALISLPSANRVGKIIFEDFSIDASNITSGYKKLIEGYMPAVSYIRHGELNNLDICYDSGTSGTDYCVWILDDVHCLDSRDGIQLYNTHALGRESKFSIQHCTFGGRIFLYGNSANPTSYSEKSVLRISDTTAYMRNSSYSGIIIDSTLSSSGYGNLIYLDGVIIRKLTSSGNPLTINSYAYTQIKEDYIFDV